MIKYLGLDDGPNFDSGDDLMDWFEEVGEDELEELREYQLEQMPDSNGDVPTSYDEGPNEREEDLTDDEPLGDIPNGHGRNPPGGGGNDDYVPCQDESPYDYLYECLDEHSNAECDVICHGNEDYDEDLGYEDCKNLCDYGGCWALCGSITLKFLKTKLGSLVVGGACGFTCGYYGCSALCGMLYD